MNNNDAEAARVRRVDTWGSRALVTVAILALVFTMVNVQTFAATGNTPDTLQWWIAWLLDPMASITLGAAIIYDNVLADHGRPEPRLTAVKWFAGVMTWGMNIWRSVSPDFTPSGIWLHSVAPGLVLLLAWATPRVRQRLTDIIATLEARAAAEHARQDDESRRVRAELISARAALSDARAARDEAERRAATATSTAQAPAVAPSAAPTLRPRPSTASQPPLDRQDRPRANRAPTARPTGRSTAATPVDLINHARSILAVEPTLGRRELAKRLSTATGASVTPYAAQRVREELDRPLRVVGGRS